MDKYQILKKKDDLVIITEKRFDQRPEGNFVIVKMRQIPFRDLNFFLMRKWAWIESPLRIKEFYEGGILFTFLDRKNDNVVKFSPFLGSLYWGIFPFIHPIRWIVQNPRLRMWMAKRRGKRLQKSWILKD